jgi:hypothetical protein
VAFTMTPPAERRGATRLGPLELPDDVQGRVRPGHQVRVLDMSPCGVLIETGRRLLPGSTVELQLETATGRHVTRAHVVRCYVGAVRAHGVVFRAGLELERPISWWGEPQVPMAGTGSSRHTSEPGHSLPTRGEASPRGMR